MGNIAIFRIGFWYDFGDYVGGGMVTKTTAVAIRVAVQA